MWMDDFEAQTSLVSICCRFVVQQICNKLKPVKFELEALCCRVELENVFNSSANVFAG